MNRRGIIVGGCAYRMAVDARHAAALAVFAGATVGSDHWQIVEISYRHTSALPAGRAAWIRDALAESRADLAISIDSDTAFDAIGLRNAIGRVRDGDAMAIAPVRIGGTKLVNLNVLGDDGAPRRMTSHEFADLPLGGAIHSGGFGLVIHNLAWYRAHWARPEAEGIAGDLGEDIAWCLSVGRRGGRITAAHVGTTHYAYQEPAGEHAGWTW